MKDSNGQYNFEGFTQLEDYVAAELVKYPHSVGLSFYHEAGVFTIEDKIKWDLYGMISDASKEVYGSRMRFDFLQYSVEELSSMYDSYVDQLLGAQDERHSQYEANIKAMMQAGATSEEQAKAWLADACGDEYDYEAEEANMWNEQIQALEDEYLVQIEEQAA